MTDLEIATKMVAKAQNAKSRGIPFEISFKHFKKLMLQKRCAYTKQILVEPGGHVKDNQRSIDRVDASVGYTDANTVVCTHSFNVMKANLTIEALHQIMHVVLTKK